MRGQPAVFALVEFQFGPRRYNKDIFSDVALIHPYIKHRVSHYIPLAGFAIVVRPGLYRTFRGTSNIKCRTAFSKSRNKSPFPLKGIEGSLQALKYTIHHLATAIQLSGHLTLPTVYTI